MTVPFVDLKRTTRKFARLALSDWTGCVQAAEFVDGYRVKKLERMLSEKLEAPHVVTCANGTDALSLGLLALGVRPGDVVALPNLTFWATYEAVWAVGAKPLLLDVDREDLQLSLSALKEAHERHRFSAAVLVHLFGWTSGQLDALRFFCRDRCIALLEDGAQAFGVRSNGHSVFADASVGTLSFYPAKVIGGVGDGGAVTCQTDEQAEMLRSLRNHGRPATGGYAHERVGVNSRMSEMQAAYLCHMVEASDSILGDRREALGMYRQRLECVPSLTMHGAPLGVTGNGYLAAVTSSQKDGPTLSAALTERGIGNARTYPMTICEQSPARGAMTHGDLEVSRWFCRRVVNLPLFYGIRMSEIGAAAEAMLEAA